MTIKDARSVYFVGIRGVGMTALAIALSRMGKKVLGSDVLTSLHTPTDRLLKREHILVYDTFDTSHIDTALDYLVIPVLHGGPDNMEVKKADALGITTRSYAQVVGDLTDLCRTSISVCGAHGKTTTSALLASILNDLHKKTTYIVGVAEFNNGEPGGGSTGFDYGVFEADEYVTSIDHDNTPKLLYQHPNYILATNIDFDHPDVFKSLDAVIQVFEAFFHQTAKTQGQLIYCKDSPPLAQLVRKMHLKAISYGLDTADYTVKNISIVNETFHFQAYYKQIKLIDCTMQLKGEHQVRNVIGVIALCHQLGLDLHKVTKSIARFAPVQRRLQKIYENKIVYFEDYAHHPTEVNAIIETMRMIYPHRRIIMIFQPHTYSRTLALKQEFIDAFSKPDHTYLLPIYGSVREKQSTTPITSEELVETATLQQKNTIEAVSEDIVVQTVLDNTKAGDVILTVRANVQIYTLQDQLITAFKKNNW